MPTPHHHGLSRFWQIWIFTGLCTLGLSYWWLQTSSYTPPALSFDGDSSNLHELAIVPTLDTPMPPGKSVLWCSSLQIAWNQLKQDIVKEPIRIEGAEAIADRLNRAEQSLSDISADSVYAVAGLVRDGINGKIRSEMHIRFPGTPVPELDEDPLAITAFAHLSAGVKYTHPFQVNPNSLDFTDTRGQKTSVASFGIPVAKKQDQQEAWGQVRILYASYFGKETREFALDLSIESQPNQIVLALMKPEATLADTLSDLQGKMAKYQTEIEATGNRKEDKLGFDETLLVPLMHWRTRHQFRELIGAKRLLLNECCRSQYLNNAYQDVEFLLDAEGAGATSSAISSTKSSMERARIPTDFKFDRPFLIYLKKRDAKHPFFVMWVNDAELLLPR
ncbi:MAG TPA: hypothetical protein VGP68_15300 [Gemmataceae bacterium]|jgi:hypothetical protein|nr:hypothetical protein [Gemmataceae bacterium]